MEAVRRVAALQDGIVSLEQAKALGISAKGAYQLCRAGAWRRVGWKHYRVLDGEHSRRARMRAAVGALGPHAVIVLDTAAEIYGIAGLPRTDDIHVSLPGDAARAQRSAACVDPALVAHQLVIPDAHVTQMRGLPVTTPARTVADILLRHPRLAAVAFLDSALNRGIVTPDDLAAALPMMRRRRGCIDAREYLTEADARAASPLETRVRLRCVDGRVPPDDLQHVIRDDDGFVIAAADLAWLRPKIIGEADGRQPHGQPEALYRDRRRQNQLAKAGWRVLRFTWSDTYDPAYIPEVVRSALRA